MAQTIFIDDFVGEPMEFYELLHEKLRERDIPNMQVSTIRQFGRKLGFLRREENPCLRVEDGVNYDLVFAYQYGRCFSVSTKSFWRDLGMARREREGQLRWGEEVYSCMFSESVDRAVRDALVEYVSGKGLEEIPADLQARTASVQRSAQVTQAE